MGQNRYNLENLKRALKQPSLLGREVKRVGSRLRRHSHETVGRRAFHKKYGYGTDVMAEDWDNLIILDGCRYDVFREENTLEGRLDKKVSKGSHSIEFIEENFNGRQLHDSVCISANPYAAKTLEKGVFHDVIRSYGEEYPDNDAAKYEMRNPEKVYELSIDARQKYDSKRLIVHFMQPHSPYLGPKAEHLREELHEDGIYFSSWPDVLPENEDVTVLKDLLEAAEKGHIDTQDLREIYVENFHIVLDYVESLISDFDGKTVITADHGELLGDGGSLGLRKFRHPRQRYCKELRVVPWFVVESETRKEIIPEKPAREDVIDDRNVKDQLESLGYL